MKYLIIIVVFIGFIGCQSRSNRDITIDSADDDYNNLDLNGSRHILNTLLKIDSLDSETRIKVLQRLAFQDWKYFKDYKSAKNRLTKSDSIGLLNSKTWGILARIEREAGNYLKALSAAELEEKYAESVEEKRLAQLRYAHVVYDLSISSNVNNNNADTTCLTKATSILNNIIESDIGSPLPSKLLLVFSLIQNNGADLLKAWKSYFHITDIEKAYPYLNGSARELKEICDKWNGKKLKIEEQEKLIQALAASRFYEYALDYALYNSDESKYNQYTKDILTYAKYLKIVKNKTDEYYRLIAIDEVDEVEYKDWLANARQQLWNDISFLSDKKYSESEFLNETKKHFGARGFTGATGNYKGYVLCLGHIVNQEKATVKQYGYKPEFIYTQIDLMISNGYSSWFWEDRAIGGWGTDNEIIRVREVYLDGPFNAWNSIADTLERKKTEKLIIDFTSAEYKEEKNTVYDGLATKLRFDALSDLYDSLYTEGLRGNNLKLAFLSTYEHFRTEASILGHEGRHSIEQKYLSEKFKNWSNEVREFHAKLSQIIFATEPRLELHGMINEISETAHGIANRKIVKIAENWIKNNSGIINGYSSDRSPLSQLYLLTNKQIKECYQSVDPMYMK